MSAKRNHPVEDGDRPPKRAKAVQAPPVIEEINFARQLQQLLTFRQDGTQQLRDGIASFKAFLEGILYHKDNDNRGRQLSILREYLDTQKPDDINSLDRPFLTQLWQAWSFGSQNHDDYLVSPVSSILALLLKTLSGILDLRDHGLLLCRTVIQNQHLRLIKRCLDAPKHKEHIISPSLRLLTETTSFDGGALAREVYKRREQTFDIATLRRTLGLVKTDISEEEAKRRPSLRTQALRYVLQHLKYLHEGGKIDILKNRGLCTSLFHFLRDDPGEVVVDLLSTIEQHILKDAELPRSTKAAILTSQNLERVTEVAARGSEETAASNTAFAWLKTAVTNPSYGLLRPHGWYPPGLEHAERSKNKNFISTGVESLFDEDGERSYNIRNMTMLTWIRTLRPHANAQERDLFIATLTAAPELVAPWVADRSILMEPKLTNTWIGLASVLFEVVRLPVPEFLGGENEWALAPPSPSIIIENVLPRPLPQKVLTRCINQSSKLISFFAIRILVMSFQKLQTILQQMKDRAEKDAEGSWSESRELLIQLFVERCPAMKDIIAAFRQIPDDDEHALQREAITRLLRLYYEVTPLQALEEQFEISTPLTAALTRSEQPVSGDETPERAELRALELEHLLTIAQFSTGIKWFHKGSLQHSPIVTLLRIHRKDVSNHQVRNLIAMVLEDYSILVPQDPATTTPAASHALVASVMHLADDDAAWEFVDDCIARASRKPVKYVDDLEALSTSADEAASLPSILAAVVLEQASFVAADKSATGNTKAAWIRLFLELLDHTSDAGQILKSLTATTQRTLGPKGQGKVADVDSLLKQVATIPSDDTPTTSDPNLTKDESFHLSFSSPPAEPTSHPSLSRWSQKDLDLAIEDGDIDSLILCLSSSQDDIRRQAHVALTRASLLLRRASPTSSSSMENSQQLSLVLGEICETFSVHHLTPSSSTPLPYLTSTFGMHAFRAQQSPSCDIYPKLNKFLIRGPEWRSARLPGYWLSNTLLTLPSEDDTYWKEVRWVLDWLIDGLRTRADFEILRRASAFERLFALAASTPTMRESVCELVYRATALLDDEDGTAPLALVTRFGVLSWLDMMQTMMSGNGKKGDEGRVYAALRARVEERCDPQRLKDWQEGKRREKKAKEDVEMEDA